jgi:hypothetical protein
VSCYKAGFAGELRLVVSHICQRRADMGHPACRSSWGLGGRGWPVAEGTR